MIAQPARARSGITLTEILISILIMGVGLVSLATLFPIGLVRMRDAARQSRSGLLAESVVGNMGSGNLLDKSSFAQTYYGVPGIGNSYDPFITDRNGTLAPLSANALTGGLPVCYDPLWRSVTGIIPVVANPSFTLPAGSFSSQAEARFGVGTSLIRTDDDGNPPSAYGLQRISNFVPWCAASQNYPLTYPSPGGGNPAGLHDFAESTFVSSEDVVMQNNLAGQEILLNQSTSGTASGVVPMFFPNTVTNNAETRIDYHFSWLFTGKQIDVTNGTIFEGDIVVMENRPFGVETFPGSPTNYPSGETVVEAVYGPGGLPQGFGSPNYVPAASRSVLLRWPSTMPDPEVKVGSWFADVTYERFPSISDARQSNAAATGTTYPMQRCYWYQIAKKSEIINEYDPNAQPYQAGYRRMTVFTTSPIRAQTLVVANGKPVNVNVALIMPSVINVFSKTFYVR